MIPAPATHADNLDACVALCARMKKLRKMLMGPSQTEPDQPLQTPLCDAVGLFEELGIRYALIGGLAALYFGRARFTEDVDFAVELNVEAILARHGDRMSAWHFEPGCTWKLYHASGIEVDLWKDEHTAGIIERALEAQFAGRSLKIIEPHDLIAMKLRAGRMRDFGDVASIVQRYGKIVPEIVKSKVTAEEFAKFELFKDYEP